MISCRVATSKGGLLLLAVVVAAVAVVVVVVVGCGGVQWSVVECGRASGPQGRRRSGPSGT